MPSVPAWRSLRRGARRSRWRVRKPHATAQGRNVFRISILRCGVLCGVARGSVGVHVPQMAEMEWLRARWPQIAQIAQMRRELGRMGHSTRRRNLGSPPIPPIPPMERHQTRFWIRPSVSPARFPLAPVHPSADPCNRWISARDPCMVTVGRRRGRPWRVREGVRVGRRGSRGCRVGAGRGWVFRGGAGVRPDCRTNGAR
jgi:hypothetical protein